MSVDRKQLGGLYLVVDTRIPAQRLLPIVEDALKGGVDILQLWGEAHNADTLKRIGEKILLIARRQGVVCLIADNVDVCRSIGADGVHFDGYEIPGVTPNEAKKMLGGAPGATVVGVTCGNSIQKWRWAEENGADYISFCSVFPSSSVDTCEMVPLGAVRRAKQMLSIPVFASGGITLLNVDQVIEAGADGIAVVSSILNAPAPREAAEAFKKKILARILS